MKTFKQYLTEVRILNPRSTLERHGAIIDIPADDSWIRVRKFTSSEPFELTSIQVGSESRGSAIIALALVKRARELAGEPISLSDVRSPDGKRLAQAVRRLGWTETRDGKEWLV